MHLRAERLFRMSKWINTTNDLEKLCGELECLEAVALDTEFIRTDTFYPKLALIQISDGQGCWLIDVLSVSCYKSLKFLLENPRQTVIFHCCLEDIEVLEYSLNICPTNIFDTQLAAGIVNIGFSMGYARLLETLTEVRLQKQETRSNWLARPLNSDQLAYAEHDVIYLHRLHKILSKKLDELSRWSWLKNEIEYAMEMVEQRKDVESYYERIKGAKRLNGQELCCLKRLCIWRESLARENDLPRGFVLSDSVLLGLARKMPSKRSSLSDIEGLSYRDVKRYGDAILVEILKSAEERPLPRLPKSLSRANAPLMKVLRQVLRDLADRESIPIEFLATKKELEHILRTRESGCLEWPWRFTNTWRKTVVKPEVDKFILSYLTS